jgi:hypothetical protein
MKKLVLALIVALALAPFSAFGMEMMTDDGMKDVTAQAGVAIAIDDVIIEQFVGATKYIDQGGIGSADFGGDATLGGAITIGARHKIQHINAIFDQDMAINNANYGLRGTHYTYSGNEAFIIQALAIDIGTPPILSTGLANLKAGIAAHPVLGGLDAATWVAAGIDKITHLTYDESRNLAQTNIVGVCITLPTVEIFTTGDIYSIGAEVVNAETGATLTGGVADTYHNQGRDFIRIYKEDSSLAILGGRMEIAPK